MLGARRSLLELHTPRRRPLITNNEPPGRNGPAAERPRRPVAGRRRRVFPGLSGSSRLSEHFRVGRCRPHAAGRERRPTRKGPKGPSATGGGSVGRRRGVGIDRINGGPLCRSDHISNNNNNDKLLLLLLLLLLLSIMQIGISKIHFQSSSS